MTTTEARPRNDREWRLVRWLTAAALLGTLPYVIGVLLPYYVNGLHHLPLEELASGRHDPKDLWPQGVVGGLAQLAGVLSLALTPLALAFIGLASAAVGVVGMVTAEIRRTTAAAMLVLAVACTLGVAWFLGDTSAALSTWRMD